MKEIIFATGNNGKIATLKSHFSLAGLDIAITQQPLELIEPQAATATEVATVKAQQAYDLLQKPVLVDDSSFHIHALGGFPGPYIKYMLETVGADGIVKFMQGQSDRRAYFMGSLVFVDESGKAHIFEGKDPDGEIIDYVDANDHPEAWSDLWKIFAPPGREGKTYSQLSYEELRLHRTHEKKSSAYTQFTDWLKSVY
jgi:XTP/dITP diphosphohydrolase